MPILSNFMVKHIRPFGEEGYNTFANEQTIQFLNELVTPQEVQNILNQWQMVALSDPLEQSNLFVGVANEVAEGRWGINETDKSTVMFLDDVQLESLSHINVGRNRHFEWVSPTPIAATVTIHNESFRHHIIWDATGFAGATNADGWVSHFSALLPR